MDKRILIVDDEPTLSKILKDFLVNEGMVVSIANNGKEAFEPPTTKVTGFLGYHLYRDEIY